MKVSKLIPTLGVCICSQFVFSSTSSAEVKDLFLVKDLKESNFVSDNLKPVFLGSEKALAVADLKKLNESNLYVIKIPSWRDPISSLEQISKVHLYVEGEFAVVEPKKSELEVATFAHQLAGGCGGLTKLGDWAELSLTKEPSYAPLIPVNTKDPIISGLQGDVSSGSIYNEIKALEAFGTRYHKSDSGVETSRYLKGKYEALIPASRKDVTVSLVDVKDSPQDNVVVRIEGSENSDEVVILGSHIDSIAGWGGKSAPGADDNASGTATNLEIFKTLMKHGVKPKRTVEIHGYAAEEVGLVGSGQLAREYASSGKKVVAMVQMDMNLYSGRRLNLEKMWFVENGTNPTLTQNLMTLARNYLSVEALSRRLYGGTSDHQSWAQRGYAAAFPFENPEAYNPKIHTGNDRVDFVGSADFSALYAKLGVSYVAHYAGL